MIRYNRKNSGEVTLGEILVAIFIALVMIIIGVLISLNIVSAIEKDNEKYESILQLSSNEQDLFKYSMDTNVGNALVNGEFEAVDTVVLDELLESYLIVERIKERYTEHTEVETYRDDDGNTHTRTVTYKEWDYISKNVSKSKQVKFMGQTFDSKKFDFSNYMNKLRLNSNSIASQYTKKVKGNYLYENSKTFWRVGDIRYYYKVVPINLSGTVFANLSDKDILPADENVITVYDMGIEEFLDHNKGMVTVFCVIFWIFWVIITGVLIFAFVTQRNRWADIEL